MRRSPERLNALLADTGSNAVWCTSWDESAWSFGFEAGLHGHHLAGACDHPYRHEFTGWPVLPRQPGKAITAKVAALLNLAEAHPKTRIVWADDDATPALARKVGEQVGDRLLVIRPAYHWGLTDQDVAAMRTHLTAKSV